MRKSPELDLSGSQDEKELSAWMRTAQAGDSVSYRQLLGRIAVLVRTGVRNSLHRMGILDAASEEDVVQEILLAIHVNRNTYDPDQFFLPWFYAIVRYKVIDFARKSKRTATQPFDETELLRDDERNPEVLAGDRLDLQEGIGRLPKKQREIFSLAKLEGLSLEEVSMKTGFSVADVKVNVHRAMKALRKGLKEHNSED
jgi:RNA polymerase sigma-70 factor (ECF subfamily)